MLRKSPAHITCASYSHVSKPPKMDPPARESVNSLHHSFHNHQRHRHHLSHHVLIPISPMSVGLISMLLVKSSCLLGSTRLFPAFAGLQLCLQSLFFTIPGVVFQ